VSPNDEAQTLEPSPPSKFLQLATLNVARGLRVTPLQGKAAFIDDWPNRATNDPDQIAEWGRLHPEANCGCVTSKDTYWIWDVDSTMAVLERLSDAGLKLPNTYGVRTGGGGYQFYFQQDDYSRRLLSNRACPNPNLDLPGQKENLFEVLHDGRQGVGAGSIHPDTGQLYEVYQDLPLAVCEPKLVDFLVKQLNDQIRSSDESNRYVLREGLGDVEKFLRDHGLKFDKRTIGDLVYYNYHVQMGRCLVKGELHRHAGNAQNRDLCSFVHDVKAGGLWHFCFACQEKKGQLRTALKGLGVDPSQVLEKRLPKLVVSPLSEFLSRKFKEREVVLRTQNLKCPVFYRPSLNQIHAWRGVGKTTFALGLCGALAKGEKFLCYEPSQAYRVLYVEGEMPGTELQERAQLLIGDCENFQFIALEEQVDFTIPSIATSEGRALIEEACLENQIEVLTLDSISTLANVPTNDEELWLDINKWLIRLRTGLGICVFFLNHDGKSGLQRGHSKIEDPLDKSLHLTWEKGYRGQSGVKALLEFDKARQPIREGSSLKVELVERDGQAFWVYSYTEQARKQLVLDLRAQGKTYDEIQLEFKKMKDPIARKTIVKIIEEVQSAETEQLELGDEL